MPSNTDGCKELFSALTGSRNQLLQLVYATRMCSSMLAEIEVPQTGRSALDSLRQSAFVVDDFLLSLIDLACLSKEMFEPCEETFSVKSLLWSLRDTFAESACARGIDFDVATDSTLVYGDPTLIEKMLKRLVIDVLYFHDAERVAIRCLRKGRRLSLMVSCTTPREHADRRQEGHEERVDQADFRAVLDFSQLNITIARRLGRLLAIPIRRRSTPEDGAMVIIDLPIHPADLHNVPMPAPGRAGEHTKKTSPAISESERRVRIRHDG